MEGHPVLPLMRSDMGWFSFNSFVWISSRFDAPHPIMPRQKYSLTQPGCEEVKYLPSVGREVLVSTFGSWSWVEAWTTAWLQGHHMPAGLGSSSPRWLHGATVVGRCSLPPHGDVGLDAPLAHTSQRGNHQTCSPVPFPMEGHVFSDR